MRPAATGTASGSGTITEAIDVGRPHMTAVPVSVAVSVAAVWAWL